MSHNYLFDTYSYLEQRMSDIKPTLTGTDENRAVRSFAAGRIEALCELERFLKEHYEMKLPRRLRNKTTPAADNCAQTN